MLKLIQGLANCDEQFFRGWILAKADIDITGRANNFINEILWQKASKTLMRVSGFNNNKQITQNITVLLLLPKKSLAPTDFKGQIKPIFIPDNIIFTHRFSRQEIADYVHLSGDKNIIHQVKNPIVPGLCMAYFLQKMLHRHYFHWQIAFLAPVYADDEVIFTQEYHHICAYVAGKLVFKIKIL